MLLLRLMNMKAKKKEIPWNLLLKDFKMESGEEDKELLQEWLQEGMNRDLYQVLKVIWFILLFNRSKINEKVQKILCGRRWSDVCKERRNLYSINSRFLHHGWLLPYH